MTFTSTGARIAFISALITAVIGCNPILERLRQETTVVDTTTGETRPATPEELAAPVQPFATGAKTLLVTTGNPQWAFIVDAAVKAAAVTLAYLIRPRPNTAELLQVALAPAPVPPGAPPFPGPGTGAQP